MEREVQYGIHFRQDEGLREVKERKTIHERIWRVLNRQAELTQKITYNVAVGKKKRIIQLFLWQDVEALKTKTINFSAGNYNITQCSRFY